MPRHAIKGLKRVIINTGTMMMAISMQETRQIDYFSCINEHTVCICCEKLMERRNVADPNNTPTQMFLVFGLSCKGCENGFSHP